MSYSHFSTEERFCLYSGIQLGMSTRRIAEALGRRYDTVLVTVDIGKKVRPVLSQLWREKQGSVLQY